MEQVRTGWSPHRHTGSESWDFATWRKIHVSRPAPQRFSKRCQQSGRSSQAAFCVTENACRFQSCQRGDEVLQHWFQLHVQLPTWSQQFLHCSTSTNSCEGERKGIQIVSSALKMRREPKSNPLTRHRYPSLSPFLLSHIYLHVSLIYLKPAGRSRLNFNFTQRGGKLAQIFLEV